MLEKIDDLNSIMEKNARRVGFLFANPNPSFDGHELCSGINPDEIWMFPLVSDAPFHPKAAGQEALAEVVLSALENDGFETFTVLPNKAVTYSFVVGSPKEFLSLASAWPGSDVSLTLISPSGKRFDRGTEATGATRETGATFERVEVAAPETGEWTAELFGVDVPAAGEPVTLSVYQADLPNVAPTAVIKSSIEGDSLVLDASESTDSDGSIVSYDWYFSTADTDQVLQGPEVTVPLSGSERTITLVVSDDRGSAGFRDLAWTPIDVMPGSDRNPMNLNAGVTPVALLSSVTFDAMGLAPSTLRLGPSGAPVEETTARGEDVNGDGLLDQVVHVKSKDLGLTPGATQLCMSGELSSGRSISACDRVNTP
jgi:hypothetical protein